MVCLTKATVKNVVKWFRKQPVRVFRIHHWGVDADDDQDVGAQELCETIFNCPTYDTLAFVNCYLNGIDFANCTFQMRSLEIRGGMDGQTSKSLLNHLAGSRVTQFKWVPDSNDVVLTSGSTARERHILG
ncbi:hypothetical protein AC1031_011309 [Aphanomyces cochlioides]|nr:hypothetical protein AC1031_011309 [Aphanomyces cochlioides]